MAVLFALYGCGDEPAVVEETTTVGAAMSTPKGDLKVMMTLPTRSDGPEVMGAVTGALYRAASACETAGVKDSIVFTLHVADGRVASTSDMRSPVARCMADKIVGTEIPAGAPPFVIQLLLDQVTAAGLAPQ